MPNCRTNINSFSATEFVMYRPLEQLQLLQSFTSEHRLHFIDNCLIYARPPITNKICQNIGQKLLIPQVVYYYYYYYCYSN